MKTIIKRLKRLLRGVIIHKGLKTMKMLTICILPIFLGTAVTTTAAADEVNLDYMSADTASDNGPQDGVFDSFRPYNFGSVNNNGYTSFRTALEFDISTIPTGSVINSATLSFHAGCWEGERDIELHGYDGDGDIQLGDFALDGLVAGTTLNPTGVQAIVFDVQSFVAGLVTNGDSIAGFNLREEPANTANYLVMRFTMTGNQGPILFIDFETAKPVSFDIKPGDDPNCMNINGHGVIPTAILGSEDFDVTQIDASTLRFAGLEVRVRGKKGPMCHVEDVSGDGGVPDGYLDLVCQFEDDPSQWEPGDDTAEVIGNLFEQFGGTPIVGSDSICVTQE